MEELLKLFGQLQHRLEEHHQKLSQSEALTRYALIDPLLRGLGWDTADPDQVFPEYPIPSKPKTAADYALFAAENTSTTDHRIPSIIVEAKKLGDPLLGAAEQAIHYCNVDGFEHFAVTDGQRWQLYETRAPGSLQNKLMAQFDLTESVADTCLTALVLWRPAVVVSVMKPGKAPLTRGKTTAATAANRHVAADSQPPPKLAEPTSPHVHESMSVHMAAKADKNWIPLTRLDAQPYAKPQALKFPSGDELSTNSGWKDLITASVRWLWNTGHLSETNVPILSGKRYLVATTPKHPDGKSFRAARQAGTLYVETHFSGKDIVRHTIRIINRTGASAAEFQVRMHE